MNPSKMADLASLTTVRHHAASEYRLDPLDHPATLDDRELSAAPVLEGPLLEWHPATFQCQFSDAHRSVSVLHYPEWFKALTEALRASKGYATNPFSLAGYYDQVAETFMILDVMYYALPSLPLDRRHNAFRQTLEELPSSLRENLKLIKWASTSIDQAQLFADVRAGNHYGVRVQSRHTPYSERYATNPLLEWPRVFTSKLTGVAFTLKAGRFRKSGGALDIPIGVYIPLSLYDESVFKQASLSVTELRPILKHKYNVIEVGSVKITKHVDYTLPKYSVVKVAYQDKTFRGLDYPSFVAPLAETPQSQCRWDSLMVPRHRNVPEGYLL